MHLILKYPSNELYNVLFVFAALIRGENLKKKSEDWMMGVIWHRGWY